MHKELRRCLRSYPIWQMELEDTQAALAELDNISPATSKISLTRADGRGVSAPVEREAIRRKLERVKLTKKMEGLLWQIATIDLGLRFLDDGQKKLIRRTYFDGAKLPKHRRKEHKEALETLAAITRIYDPQRK